MSSNRLRLNPTKTQFIWFGTRQQLAKIDLGSLAIKYQHFTFSSSVRDLRVTLDQELTFVQHINLLCRSCYYQLRQLRVVSCSLSPAAASTLAHAFVVSRLDYCSAIYEGLPTCRVKCLDRVLRTAARLVGRIPRFDGVSGYMRDVLRWLPYPQRIVYRISALVRRCMEGLAHPISGNFVAPLLLFSVISHYTLLPRRSCWSPERGLLSDSAEPSLWLVRWLGMVNRLRCV